jgi:hypothetical protein
MSSGAIMMVGGAGGGANVSTMTVGVTNSKGLLYHGFVALPFAVPSDESTPQIGSLSPNHVTVSGVNYTVHRLSTQNHTSEFVFAVADPDENLSATSITSVATILGTATMSALNFYKVTEGGVNYASWAGNGQGDIFGTTEDFPVVVTFNV